MSTLIPHEVSRIDSGSDYSICRINELYLEVLRKNKTGIILDSRKCKDFSSLMTNIEAWECTDVPNFEIVSLITFDQFKNLPKLNSNRIEKAILVDHANQILDKQIQGLREQINLVIQTKTKKDLFEIMQNHECIKILKSGPYSILPNLNETARYHFSAKDYYDVVKKFDIKRDYRFPHDFEDQSKRHFDMNVLRSSPQNRQSPEISVIVPHDIDFAKIRITIDSLLTAALHSNTPIEIIAVGNNFKDSVKDPDLFIAGHARNEGVRHACAPIVCFIDSDISVGKDFFKHMKQILQSQEVVQFKRYYGPKEKILEPSYWSRFYKTKNWSEIKDFWRYTCTYSLAMHIELFRQSGQFQTHFLTYGFEDVDLGYRMSKITNQFYLSDQKVMHSEVATNRMEFLYRFKRFRQISRSASFFFLDHLDYEVGHLVRNFLRWEHFKARVSLCNVFFQDKNRVNEP